MDMLVRERLLSRIQNGFRRGPIVAILGPRQCGKTTLARLYMEGHPQLTYYDLSKENDRQALKQPYAVLEPLKGLIVLDEVQKEPKVFDALRVLVDRTDNPAQFLILGSSSPSLIKGTPESLAGRIAFIEMGGFSIREVNNEWEKLWVRGGFPRSFLSFSEEASFEWREDFVRTFVERDIFALGLKLNPSVMNRFISILANYHGKIFNAAQIADMMDLSAVTIKRYLDILAGSFLMHIVQPWHENLEKRQVKSPKVYFRDTGLLHFFYSFTEYRALLSHPAVGFSFEGFVMDHIIRLVGARYVYFWKIHSGAKLDAFIQKKGKRIGIEIKFNAAPKSSKSMRVAHDLLKLDCLFVVYPGDKLYLLESKIQALPITELSTKLDELELA